MNFDARPGVEVTPEDASTDVPLPPPVSNAGAIHVVAGPAQFLQSGPPCTGEVGSTADTWCGFVAPSRLVADSKALYVVNLTAAAAGTPIACGTVVGDPNCLVLTAGFVEDATHSAFFQGNTLVYFDSTGVPYGWRPGMVNGRRLAAFTSTSGDVHDCMPAKAGNAIACLQDVVQPATGAAGGGGATAEPSTAVYSDLLVGPVDATSPILSRVDTVISSDSNDSVQRFRFRIIGASAERIAWSSRAVPGGPEVLTEQLIGDDTSRHVVASDVSRWAVSSDSTQWAWLSGYNYGSQNSSGTLQVAPFPGGALPVTVLTGIASFLFAPGTGMSVMSDSKELFGIPDPRKAPDVAVRLDIGVVGVLALSSVGHVAYAKDYDFVFGLVDLHVQKLDGTGNSCTLDRLTEVPFASTLAPRFLPSGSALVWSRVTNLDTTDARLKSAGRLTELTGCTSMTFDPDVVSTNILGDNAITFADNYDGASGTLLTQRVVGGTMLAPGGATVVQTRMNSSLSLYPFLNALVYTVNVGDPNDGIYLYALPPPG